MESGARPQFSSKLEARFFGPPTDARVVGIRDVLICPTGGGGDDISAKVFRSHPPIGSQFEAREGRPVDPVAVGRGARADRLDDDESELVMNACSPRGHYFVPIRQFGQRFTFIRDLTPEEGEHRLHQWDPDGVLWDVLAMSRLVRDNAYSTEYAARIIDYEDGEQVVAYSPGEGGKYVYRMRQDRDWPDQDEARELAQLLDALWAGQADRPLRIRRGLWRAEYASWVRWGDLILPIIVSGLEALLKTERHRATAQFATRVPAVANELEVDGIDPALCEAMYDARSEWIHGARVRLFTVGEQGDGAGPESEDDMSAFADIVRLQDLLRLALRRCIEDQSFASTFTDDDHIRERWPVPG